MKINKTKNKTIKYGDTVLTVMGSKSPLVPSEAIEVSLPEQVKSNIARVFTEDMFGMLIGEAGTGKSSIVRELAYKLQMPYVRYSCSEGTDETELIGTWFVDGKTMRFKKSAIIEGIESGSVVCLDEINQIHGTTLAKLHGLLDEEKSLTLPDGSIVKFHKDTRLFVTINPNEVGTKSFGKPFLDRFIIQPIEALSHDQEIALLVARTGITKDQATQLVAIATKARIAYFEDTNGNNPITVYVSTRSLVAIGKLVKSGLTIHEAYKLKVMYKTFDKSEQLVMNDFAIQVLKMAEDSNKDNQPIVTTQAELDKYKKQGNDAIFEMKKAIAQAEVREAEVIKLKRELDIIEKTTLTQADIDRLKAENKDLQEAITAYELLEKRKQKLEPSGSDKDIVNSNT